VEISKKYSRTEWREDLKRLLRRAGCDRKQLMFLFTDSQVRAGAHVVQCRADARFCFGGQPGWFAHNRGS
jgi:hypothetical protein